ncbi:MAG: hypothetical protein OCD02_21300 [Spirochaetaceae bacterium]
MDNVSINVLKKCLIVSLPAVFSPGTLKILAEEVPNSLIEFSCIGIIFDFSQVNQISDDEFQSILNISESSKLIGASPVFVGFKPGVVAAIIRLGINTDNIMAKLNIEDGVEHLINGI